MTAEKTTAVQRKRVEELQAENGGRRLYTYPVKGKAITDQFRRYVTRQDASCIGRGLYEFLMNVCGFIAEYGLVPPDGGFRIKWAEPADLIEALPGESGYSPARRGHVQRVYADGQTDAEVLDSLLKLAREHHADCALGRSDREFNRDISLLIKLAEPRQFMLVPPGWRLIPTSDAPPRAEAPPGSLAERIGELAQRNGLTLVAPPAVDPGGQVRLL